jgi:hypothetical protein
VSSNSERADVLVQALQAGLAGDHRVLADLCTADVRAWSPRFSAASLDELDAELRSRDTVFAAFSDYDLETFPLDVGGDFACVEWILSMTHTAPLQFGDGGQVEPTGLRVTAVGTTVAEFRERRICGLRQYWDESMLLRQLGLTEHRGATVDE